MDRNYAYKKASEIVSRMTIEEVASQLKYDAPAIERLNIPEYNWWNESLHGVARAGTATVFPQSIGLAATFDCDLSFKVADTISTEGRAKYNMQSSHGDRDIYKGLTFWAPNVNIFRDPRWGRGHETFGEDPHLTSRMGVAYVKGMQGNGEYLKSAACAKHYAVHSGPEKLRKKFDAKVCAKDLTETYLQAFEALVKEGDVEAVMGSYNRVNGEPSCGSEFLLKKTLREKWNFKGHVVSDCWAIQFFHEHHHVTNTATESAALALKNGCDLNCGSVYMILMLAYKEGLITEGELRTAAIRLMATRYRLGMFDDDCQYNNISMLECDTDENNALACKVAEEGIVLVKNQNNVLPLDKNEIKTIAVIGPNANDRRALIGNYHGTSSRYITFLDGIRTKLGSDVRILYSDGCSIDQNKTELLAKDNDRLAEAEAMCEAADVTILCLGLNESIEGEEGDQGNAYFSGDKENLQLPEPQVTLIDKLTSMGKKIITVVAAGSALNVSKGDAILWAWYPGQAGGAALANIIFGECNPSGKLPITIYHNITELPDFTDYSMKNRTYRYFKGKALYPFGYGLSYTNFKYTDAILDDDVVQVKVSNEGEIQGDEIVQVYIKQLGTSLAVPNSSLCAFKRVSLKSGETKNVSLTLNERAFMTVDVDGNWQKLANRFIVYVGGSQPDDISKKLCKYEPLRIEVIR